MAILLILVLNVLVFVAVNAARIVFSLYALSLGATSASVGGILATLYIFPVLLSWPIGLLADSFGARWLLAAGIASGAAGMLIPWLWPTLPSLYMASCLLGLTMAVTTVLGQNLVGVLSQPHERTRNFSNYSLTGSAAIFFGPLLAGFAIDHVGAARTCLTVALLLAAAVLLLLVRGSVLPRSRSQGRPGGNLLTTLGDRSLWPMLAVSSLSQLGNDLYQAFLPIYSHGLGLSASTIGSLMAALAIGSFGVRIGLTRLVARLGERRLLAISFYVGATVFLFTPLVQQPLLLGSLAFVFGMSLGCTQPLTMMLMFSSAADGRAGEAVGLRLMVNNIARILGPALFGAIGATAGLSAVYWINSVLMGAGGRISHAGRDRRNPRP